MGYRRFRRRYRRGRGRGRRGRGRRSFSSKKRLSIRRTRINGGRVVRITRTVNIASTPQMFTLSPLLGPRQEASGTSFNITQNYVGNGYYGMSLQFRLSDLPNYTDFVNLYDDYMIDSVTVTMRQNAPPVDAGMLVHHVNDWHDAVVFPGNDPGSVDLMRQYRTYTCKDFYKSDRKTLSWTVRPATAMMVYNTSITSAYTARRGFLDNDYADIPHYSMKFLFQPYSSSDSPVISFEMDAKYHLKLRNVL